MYGSTGLHKILIVLTLVGIGVACFGLPNRASPMMATAWVHVARQEARHGGLPVLTHSVTVSATTSTTVNVQTSKETDSDEILALRESTTHPALLWREIEKTVHDLPPSPTKLEDVKVIHEHEDARLRLVVNLPQSTRGPAIWEGEPVRAPAAVLRIVSAVETFAASQVAAAVAPGTYLRAQVVPPADARDLRKDSVGERVLHRSPFLQKAVAQPYRYLPVPEGVNPFSPIQARFVPTRSTLEVSVSNHLLQIRSFSFFGSAP